MKPGDLARVIVDTTVQPKNVTFPTDAKLLNRAREKLVKLAKKCGVDLRQSYTRVGKLELIRHQRYAHAKQFKRANKALRKLKNAILHRRQISRRSFFMFDRQHDLVQHVRGLMHPAALMPRSGKDLVERLPEAERTVTNGDFRGIAPCFVELCEAVDTPPISLRHHPVSRIARG
jgi:hypothetical protein